MESWQLYLIAIFGGLVAGFINTLAGSGSAITLPILTELMGLPPNIANGTNRVGVMAQGITTTWGFYKNGKLRLKHSWFYISLVFVGAVVGVIVATKVSNEQFKTVFSYLMVILLVVIVVKPRRWLRQTDLDFKLASAAKHRGIPPVEALRPGLASGGEINGVTARAAQ